MRSSILLSMAAMASLAAQGRRDEITVSREAPAEPVEPPPEPEPVIETRQQRRHRERQEAKALRSAQKMASVTMMRFNSGRPGQ